MDRSDSFVFYRSFFDTAQLVTDPHDRLALYEALIRFGLEGEKPDLDYPLNAILEQMTASVRSAADRYAAAKENGEKGGRPKKWVPPEEWIAYYKEHGRKATAEHFGIPESTLKHWISAMGKKGKNLNININDNENLNVNSNSNSNYQNNNNKDNVSPKTPEGVSAPRPCQVGYEFTAHDKRYRINEKMEVEEIGPASE